MAENREMQMKSYTFKVFLERDKWPDEPDEKAIWQAYIPILPAAHAWGDTRQEALENLRNAVDLIIEELLDPSSTVSAGSDAGNALLMASRF